MTVDLPIPFLQERIRELQTALFFSEHESLLKIPTHVIHTDIVDDAGQIWFVVPSPVQSIHEFDRDFPAKLDFFRKGKDYYLKIKGLASFITSEDEMIGFVNREIRDRIARKEAVVMRVRIQQADYFEAYPKQAQNWLKYGGSQLFNWLLNPQYDHKNPQLVAIPITIE
jgi:hypothetical protein